MQTHPDFIMVQTSGTFGKRINGGVHAMRRWLLDCFEDDCDFIREMDEDEIRQTIDVLYVGGISQFIADGGDNDAI